MEKALDLAIELLNSNSINNGYDKENIKDNKELININNYVFNTDNNNNNSVNNNSITITPTNIIVVGVSGSRFDHTYSNHSMIYKYVSRYNRINSNNNNNSSNNNNKSYNKIFNVLMMTHNNVSVFLTSNISEISCLDSKDIKKYKIVQIKGKSKYSIFGLNSNLKMNIKSKEITIKEGKLKL